MEFQEITLADFIQDVLPSVGHNRTQLLSMAVVQENAVREGGKGKDLLYHNVDDHYRITLNSIKAYFELPENPRPKRALSVQDENKALKAQVEELEKKLGKEEEVTPGPIVARKDAESGPEIPPKDENIPVKKLSQTDYAKKLAMELGKAKSPSAKAVSLAKKKDIPKG